MTDGIYTLANDSVCDQLVALLNSIEANAGRDIPVCVIPYDDNLEKVRAEVANRSNVFVLDNPTMMARWDEFSLQVWQAHPHALQTWQEEKGIAGVYRVGSNHRYAAFDGEAPFDRFVYLDADTLLLGPIDVFFNALDEHPFVVYDFQFKDPTHIYNVKSPRLLEIFSHERIQREIFCAGCYASRRGFFDAEQRAWLVARLAEGDADALYMPAPNQSVLNYMTMRSEIPVYNLALHLPESQVTGNSVTSPHFEERDHLVYDHGKRLTYLHYIGISAKLFRRVCDGENVLFPYRESFIHYRYLHAPESRPVLNGKPIPYEIRPTLWQRALRKLKVTVGI